MMSFFTAPAILFPESFPRLHSGPLKTFARNPSSSIRVSGSTEPEKEKIPNSPVSSEPNTSADPPPRPKKPQYSMLKGQIVRVDKEMYLNSINYLSVGHPPYYKGLDYIYEDRGEVLDIRIFETGEYALWRKHDHSRRLVGILFDAFLKIAWVGIPTAPAWLPTGMLIKSEKLDYERF